MKDLPISAMEAKLITNEELNKMSKIHFEKILEQIKQSANVGHFKTMYTGYYYTSITGYSNKSIPKKDALEKAMVKLKKLGYYSRIVTPEYSNICLEISWGEDFEKPKKPWYKFWESEKSGDPNS